MKAKCPDCDNGCDKCVSGYIEVDFSNEGHYHYYICNICKCGSGGYLHVSGRDLSYKDNKYVVCPECGSNNLRLSTCEEST